MKAFIGYHWIPLDARVRSAPGYENAPLVSLSLSLSLPPLD